LIDIDGYQLPPDYAAIFSLRQAAASYESEISHCIASQSIRRLLLSPAIAPPSQLSQPSRPAAFSQYATLYQ
jgi:hypothetical protein